jgi:hypothetical protein
MKDKIVTKKSSWPKVLAIIGGTLLVIGLIIFGGYFFKKYNDLKKNPPSADQAAQVQIDRYISEVGKLYALPKNEKPSSVVTVKDKSKLNDQPFFDDAENGDVVLLFTKAKIGILYRPSTKKLINVRPLNVDSKNASIKIIGDQISREAAEKSILTKYKDQVTIKAKTDAKTNPVGITVVDVGGTHGQLAAQIASDLKGSVGNLPAGEEKPADVDILVITGPVTTP